MQHTFTQFEQLLVDFIIDEGLITQINKSKFKYKDYDIIKSKENWNVYHNNIHIASTFLKVSAFAICLSHSKKYLTDVQVIKDYDDMFEKNYNDSVVFKHTYKNTKDFDIQNIALSRYEVSSDRALFAKQSIENLFWLNN